MLIHASTTRINDCALILSKKYRLTWYYHVKRWTEDPKEINQNVINGWCGLIGSWGFFFMFFCKFQIFSNGYVWLTWLGKKNGKKNLSVLLIVSCKYLGDFLGNVQLLQYFSPTRIAFPLTNLVRHPRIMETTAPKKLLYIPWGIQKLLYIDLRLRTSYISSELVTIVFSRAPSALL